MVIQSPVTNQCIELAKTSDNLYDCTLVLQFIWLKELPQSCLNISLSILCRLVPGHALLSYGEYVFVDVH